MADANERGPEAEETAQDTNAVAEQVEETTTADASTIESAADSVSAAAANDAEGGEAGGEAADAPVSAAASETAADESDQSEPGASPTHDDVPDSGAGDAEPAASPSEEAATADAESEPAPAADLANEDEADAPSEAAEADETDLTDDAVSADETLDEASQDGDNNVEDGGANPSDDGAASVDEEIGETDEDFKRPAAEIKAIVEALIFASPDPLTPKSLLKLLDSEPKEDVLAALDELKVDYERQSGLQLVEVAGGFQIVTRPDLHEWVRRLFHERSTQKLSVQALESLAVIAYRQPITAIEITEIRGVNTSGVLNTLLERHLVKIVGRKQVVGRPFMYATTKEFLIRFGLKDLSDLPKVEDMAESLGIESRLLVEQTPPEEQLPLSEPDADALPFADDSASESTADDEPSSSGDAESSPSDDDSDPSIH